MTDLQTPISRCVTPGQYEMRRLRIELESGEIIKVVDDELAEAIQGSTRNETLTRYQAFKQLMERACRGEATTKRDVRTRHDLEYVITEPWLWELRLEVDGWLLRQFHAEPKEHPQLLVAVKAYSKVVTGKDKQTLRDEQDAEIKEGAARYIRHHKHFLGEG